MRLRRGDAGQRRPARDVLICRADASGAVPPRRHRVAGVRPDRADRCRADPREGRAPSSATSAGCRWRRARPSAFASIVRRCHRSKADGRTSGISWTLTFADRVQAPPLPLMVVRNITDPALANVSVPLANPRRAASAGRSRRRRHALGGHRAAADPRLHQAAGLSSNCRCLNPSTASWFIRIPTMSPPRSAPTR